MPVSEDTLLVLPVAYFRLGILRLESSARGFESFFGSAAELRFDKRGISLSPTKETHSLLLGLRRSILDRNLIEGMSKFSVDYNQIKECRFIGRSWIGRRKPKLSFKYASGTGFYSTRWADFSMEDEVFQRAIALMPSTLPPFVKLILPPLTHRS